jgi:hypothetical protein
MIAKWNREGLAPALHGLADVPGPTARIVSNRNRDRIIMAMQEIGSPERRVATRRAGNVVVRCRFTRQPTDPFWPAVLCNASTLGICLHTTSLVRRKDLLVVQLPELPSSPKRRFLLARVVHVQRLPVLGGRIAGCSLVRCRLSERTLRALLGDESEVAGDPTAGAAQNGRSMPLPASRKIRQFGAPAQPTADAEQRI